MQPEMIFYWTGFAVTSILSALVISLLLVILIAAPLAVYRVVWKKLWKWKVCAEIAHTGFDTDDIQYIFAGHAKHLPPGIEIDDMLRFIKKAQERANYVRSLKNR
jgi:hypothetical protein